MEAAALEKLIPQVDGSELGPRRLADVKSEVHSVASRCRFFGEALHLKTAFLRNLNGKSPDESLSCILEEFLKKNYDSDTYGAPSWKLIVAAVGKEAGGNNRLLAEEIAKKHPASQGARLEPQQPLLPVQAVPPPAVQPPYSHMQSRAVSLICGARILSF